MKMIEQSMTTRGVRNVTACVSISLMCDRYALAASWGRIRLMIGLGTGWDMGVTCVGLLRSPARCQETEGCKQ
jgi:hypothetical protein